MTPTATAIATSSNTMVYDDQSDLSQRNAAATVPHLVAWYGTNRQRWVLGRIMTPRTSVRSLPSTFTELVIAYSPGDLWSACVTQSLFRQDALQIGRVISRDSSKLFDRLVCGPTSPELPSETTITQEVDDAIFSGDFVTAVRPALVEISRLAALPTGWDSYDAQSVDSKTCLQATTFLRVLFEKSPKFPMPEVFATPSGAVAFRWTTPNKEIEAEIESDSSRYFIESLAVKPNRRHGVFSGSDLGKLAGLILSELA
jgi:hypothetical protein